MNPQITIEMENGGTMNFELLPETAPISVANFLDLVSQGFYNGLIFHRVIPGFMIQGGCPEGAGTGGPGHTIKGEFAQNGIENDIAHEAGVLSMARSRDPDSAGSQFFIMHGTSPHLDGSYAAFGKILSGIEVVNEIAATETDHMDKPLEDWRIKTITIDEIA